ncbi:DNA polymerase [Mycobacteroides phage 8UZL]|nr:DNA polymerase [Mycobacteroides phage 8UZL]
MATSKAKAEIIDFSNVKERGNYQPKHVAAGDYRGKITKVVDDPAKDGTKMWTFTIESPEIPRATYPYYCKLAENQFFKLKSLFEAAGTSVGKRKVKVDPNRLIGKEIGFALEDDEYEGRMKSVIVEVFPASEVGDAPEDDEEEDEDLEPDADDEEEEEAEEEPEEDAEEEEEEEPEPPKRRKAPAKKAPTKRAAKKAAVEDEEEENLEDLDIDEL